MSSSCQCIDIPPPKRPHKISEVSDFQYEKTKLQLSNELKSEDIKQLVFLFSDDIPKIEAEQMTEGRQLFQVLQDRQYLGPNNVGLLCECLRIIQRQDLVKVLSEHVTQPHPALCLPPDVPSNLTYRSNLLTVCNQLREEDVKDLLVLFERRLPRSVMEKITSGLELAIALEDYNYIGSTNLACLCEGLRAIKRRNLAQILEGITPAEELDGITQREIVHPPSSSVHYQYTRSWYPRYQYKENMKALVCVRNGPKCQKAVTATLDEIILTWMFDPPASWWDPQGSKADTHRIIKGTLQSVISFYRALIDSMLIHIPKTDIQGIRAILKQCTERYEEFENVVDATQWNGTVRKFIHDHITNRKHVAGGTAVKVCETICDIRRDLLRDEATEREFGKTNNIVHTLEMFGYTSWYAVPMLQWVINLFQLAEQSVIDLGEHRELLIKAALEHRQGIIHNFDGLSRILGQGVMEKVASTLDISYEDRKVPPPPIMLLALRVSFSWHLQLVVLLALAIGYPIKPKEVAATYVSFSTRPNYNRVVDAGKKMVQMVVDRMHHEILELRTNTLELAKSRHYHDFEEVFPLI